MIIPCDLDKYTTPPENFELLIQIEDKFSKYKCRYFLYKKGNIAIIYAQKDHKFIPGKISSNQICIPIGALNWLSSAIVNFYTHPSQGGQKAGKIGIETTINGEKILLNRAVSINGTGYPGFIINNFSRPAYGVDESDGLTQDISFTDEFLVNSNFLSQLITVSNAP